VLKWEERYIAYYLQWNRVEGKTNLVLAVPSGSLETRNLFLEGVSARFFPIFGFILIYFGAIFKRKEKVNFVSLCPESFISPSVSKLLQKKFLFSTTHKYSF